MVVMPVLLIPRPLVISLKSILTVIGVSMELSNLEIAWLMPASIVATFGSLVIELSKLGSITNWAFADEQHAARNVRTANESKGRLMVANRVKNERNGK